MDCESNVYGGKAVVVGVKVNVRKDAGKEFAGLFFVNTGDIVVIDGSKMGTDKKLWYEVHLNDNASKKGWLSSDYMFPQGEPNEAAQIANGGTGIVIGICVNARKYAGRNYASLYCVNTGDVLTVKNNTTGADGKIWYEVTSDSNKSKVGWVCGDYLIPPGITPTLTYDRDAAAAYAMEHSSNTAGSDSYNKEYKFVTRNGVANADGGNFVSQCLYAGGMPMNKTWYYRRPGLEFREWVNAWTTTVPLKAMLDKRGFADKVTDKSKLVKGDIVFTFESEKSLPQVTILSRDVAADGTIFQCCHTTNVRDKERDPKIKSIYYHIHDTFKTKSGDWRF